MGATPHELRELADFWEAKGDKGEARRLRRSAADAEAEQERKERGRAQLQEVYRRLDNTDDGTRCIAWYGQLRAEEYTHAEALEQTIEHWGLRRREWWAVRFPEEVATPPGT